MPGLFVQLATLYWSHPIAFVVFLVVGVGLVAVGMLLFLWFLLKQAGD